MSSENEHAPTEARRGLSTRSTIPVIAMVATLLLLSAPPARAYRPFTGTDAGVAALHQLEVELGPLEYMRTGDERMLIGPELTLTYGAGSNYDFGVGARRLIVMGPDPEGVAPKISDVELTASKLLRPHSSRDRKGVRVLAEGELQFPPNNQQSLGFGLLLAASQSWDDAAVHLNGEVSRTSERQEGRFASLIAEGPDRWEVRPVAEAAFEREGDETALKTLLLGLIWQTRSGLAMDFAYRMGYADERLAEFRSGITWNRHVSGPRMP